jgi:5-methyltetrahydrofolate--homocysteine methyltransferase
LDSAIVNPNHYVPVDSLDRRDYELALKIIMQRDMDAFTRLEEIALVKRGQKVTTRKHYDELSAPDAIREKIKDGVKERVSGTVELDGWLFDYQDKIVERVVEAIETIPPLTLINDYLMAAMRELGDRFGAGEVSLPHLLKAADVMKQVMTFLESYMNRTAGKEDPAVKTCKAKIVLGTVYQDVHSIGKDLCKTLFENYGYEVIDLGVQVPLEKFVAVAIAEKADAVGMSALLVQTSNHMITVAQMMEKAGLKLPILIGGAPVNKRHAAVVAMRGQDNPERIKGDVFYCPSAMDGVNVMESLLSDHSEAFLAANREALRENYLQGQQRGQKTENLSKYSRRSVDFERYAVPKVTCGMECIQIPLNGIDLNEKALYSLNWKMGGRMSWRKKGLTEQDVIQMKRQWIETAAKNQWLQPQGCMGVFPCQSEGDELIIFDTKDKTRERARLQFDLLSGRNKKDVFSPAQWFLPRSSGEKDVVGLLIATVGLYQQDMIQRFQKEGDTERAYLLQGLGDRVAEDLAAMLHARLRAQVGVDAKCGVRYSPGYPGLAIQYNRPLYELLDARRLGIRLTEAFQFIPTSTTAAVVCFHPAAAYT